MSFKLTLNLNISSMAVFWKKQNSAKNVCTSGIALTPAVIWIPKFAIFVLILEHWDCSWDLISIVRSSLNSQSNGHCQMEFSIRITMKREVKARKKKEKRIFYPGRHTYHTSTWVVIQPFFLTVSRCFISFLPLNLVRGFKLAPINLS